MNVSNGIHQVDMRGHSINRDEFFEEVFKSLEDVDGGVSASELAEKLLENQKFFRTDRAIMGYIESRKSSGWIVEPRSGIFKRQPK